MSYNIIQHPHPISPSLYQDDEKKPILSHHYSSQKYCQPDLPPTPSSSALSFLVNDSKESIEDNSTSESNTNSPRLPYATHPQYGSVFSTSSSDFNYMQTTSISTTPSTISPNDDDEGLYLLWTHQLLRERGYQPSSCRIDYEDDDDCGSVDSSITDLSTPTYKQQSQQQKSTNLSSWLSSWFPMC